MSDVITTACDELPTEHREELFLKLLSYAGPPPAAVQYPGADAGYTDWCREVERGIHLLYPRWHVIDGFDATIQFRHWCNKRGAKARRKQKVNRLVNWALSPFKEREA